ncbi:hypothetical protein [Nakamurella aerolata]|uniref:hypothetical protein n=1 Tax=Nakamurella aerolata TaxID=1656892 RepID=UPI001BB23D3A
MTASAALTRDTGPAGVTVREPPVLAGPESVAPELPPAEPVDGACPDVVPDTDAVAGGAVVGAAGVDGADPGADGPGAGADADAAAPDDEAGVGPVEVMAVGVAGAGGFAVSAPEQPASTTPVTAARPEKLERRPA